MKWSSLFTYNRALAGWLAPRLARAPLTPNFITTLSLSAGLLSGICMAGGGRGSMLAGAFFLHLSFILDNCDGEVARIKGMQSAWGMWYDYAADLAVDFALWWGLAAGAVSRGGEGLIYPVAALACAGSLLNFWRVVVQRRAAAASGPGAGKVDPDAYLLGPLSDDGDPSILVWALALLAQPAGFLYLGCAYIFLVWFSSLFQKVS